MNQTTYGGRPTGPSAGMIFCQNELERMASGELKGDCFQSGEGYRCIVQFKAKRHSFGSFETIKLCNEHYDYQLKRLNNGITPEKKTRKPLKKGYRKQKLIDGSYTFYPRIMLNGKAVELGSTKCEEKAQAVYLKRFKEEFGQ